MRHDRVEQLGHRMAFRLDPKDAAELAGGNDEARGGDEAGNDRMREEIGDKAQPEQAHGHEENARKRGQHDGCAGIIGSALGRNASDGGCRHQRDHGHRPDSQRARGAEDRIGYQRQNGRVEADFGRQPGQQRIGERLRDQHDGHDHRGDEVAGQRLPVVAPAPVENGQVGLEGHWSSCCGKG
ncbi:hypothetical protein D3C87_1353540 [compost metagenome]